MADAHGNPRILIIGTQPYHPMVQSRHLDSYFHYWEKENLAQIFSDARTPIKGLCGTLFQITDYQLIHRWKSKKAKVGKRFDYEQLPLVWSSSDSKPKKKPSRKDGIFRLIRKVLWKKKYWDTPELEVWVKEFKPEALFVCFSQDFFILDIAEHFAKKYSIPMFLSITDDCYFQGKFSLNPFYWSYRLLYKKHVKSLMKKNVFGVFESEKIKKKYAESFHIDGCVQYIATKLPDIKNIAEVHSISSIRYFGNIEYGRFKSLCEVANALKECGYKGNLEVYTSSIADIEKKRHPNNLQILQPLPYEEVLKLSSQTDLLLLVEGTKKEDVIDVRYSLSTKVADCLGSGRLVLAYGGADTGALSFMREKNACLYATNYGDLIALLKLLFADQINQQEAIKRSLSVAHECFDIETEAEKWMKIAKEKCGH